ncbi:TetR/AcrR family transcriptional regulator [Microcoleus sp. FACHB-831]|uniref:TetR/AcrR family transcriptional regulator n=1 Tax=Microcoleus sp. FACHB-831 TaxID=2692827 RepID=UPI00168207C1|nr:TetR/AcrR family transcriptional regulator [Microcoleus sp. FACHB-831]MBD1920186.1 TetR/AcrR family transcriptional regulator [Microcoleus sp. FACHB-831]
MPPRDEQDYESRRQQIIDGALEVFSSKGFEKATNKDIAVASGVGSPGLIYHYFKDKSDLFRQVVEQRIPMLQLLTHSEEMMTLTPPDALTLFASTFLKVADNATAIALLKLMLGESIRRPIVAEMLNTIGPGRGFAFLTCYLEKQMDAGVMHRMDAGAAARCFIGPLIAFLLTREVFPQPDSQRLSKETMVKTLVEVFLRGMEIPNPQTN